VDISLKIVNRDIDPASENADFAFRLGDGKWDDLQSWPLFKEVYFPLCSPQLVYGDPRDVGIEQLESMNLLALKERFRKRAGWNEFFRLAGFPREVIKTSMTFSDQETLLDAAIGGQGTGIGWLGVTNHCLSTGSLVQVTNIEIETDQSFYLVAPEGIEPSRSAVLFRDWFVEECHQIQTAWEAESAARAKGPRIRARAVPRTRP
jgi:DNA-binding transcriptional LysR family regulator